MSAKTVAEKLLIKPDSTVWSSHSEHLNLIEGMPDSVRVVDEPTKATTALVFANGEGALRAILNIQHEKLAQAPTFWVAYPKANRVDINRDSLWPILSEYGMRPISQVALDDTWSALRFRALKDGEEPFTGGR